MSTPTATTRTLTLIDARNEGLAAFKAGDFTTAARIYNAILQKQPNNALIWHLLSQALDGAGKSAEALVALRKVVELEPNNAEAYSNTAIVAMKIDRCAESEAAVRKLLELKPGDIGALRKLGDAVYHQGKLAEAIETWSVVLEQAPNDAQLRGSIGALRLLMGQFEAGWPDYEWRLETPKVLKSAVNLPRWDGESLDGKTILVMAEQGLGDSIQFMRYARELKQRWSCRVIAAVQKPLVEMLGRMEGIDEVVSRDAAPPVCDFWIPVLSLPKLLNHHVPSDFPSPGPYLFAKPELVEHWRPKLARFGGVKIGIVWKGTTANAVDRRRSLSLTQFAEVGRLSGVSLISLQRVDGQEQLNELNGQFEIAAFSDDEVRTFDDTAAIMQCLDLVISVDTATCHLAGALGVPVWTVLPFIPDWRWQMSGDTTVWYPTMRLFRQTSVGDWPGVFERIVAELKSQFPQLHLKSPEEEVVATSGFNRLIRGRHGLMLFNRHDQYIGRSLDRYGDYSEQEIEVFQQVVRPGAVVVEAGANIGAHTVPMAKLVGEEGQVIAFEPQRLLFQSLCGNIALNGLANVICRNEAVGETAGTLTVPSVDYRRANNFGGLSLNPSGPGETVPVVTLDSWQLPRLDFLKADVEGMELQVVRGALRTIERCRPILYIENDRPQNSRDLLAQLMSLGYTLFWHKPALFSPNNYFQNSRNEFGNIVSINVLGIHSSLNMNITGLPRINSPDESWQQATLAR